MKWSAYRVPFVGKPFKGLWYYEWQIGPLVFQWKHAGYHKQTRFHVGPFQVWHDSAWRHNALRPIRRLFKS